MLGAFSTKRFELRSDRSRQVDVRDNDGLSPLDYTFDENTSKLLKREGADISIFGSVLGGHADRVKTLISQGATKPRNPATMF